AVGTPAQVRSIDCDATIMAALVIPSGMPGEKKAMQLHDAVDPLVVGCAGSRGTRLPAQYGVDAAVAIGRQVFDDLLDPGDQFAIGLWRTAASARSAPL